MINMSYTHKAIERAIKGGYTRLSLRNDGEIYGLTKVSFEEILLDPLFWQCLGKAMGWDIADEATQIKYGNPMIACNGDALSKWHRFIDHVAEGKDIESFFQEVLKK